MLPSLEGLKTALSAIPPAYRDELADTKRREVGVVTCNACQAKNQLPIERQAEQLRCGKCHHLLALPDTNPKSIQQILDRCSSPPVIAVVGRFSSGKSCLINALLGEEVLPYDIAPTTAKLTRLVYGKLRRLYLTDRQGKTHQKRLSDLPKFVDQTQLNHQLTDSIVELTVHLPSRLLKNGLMLVDTPGFENPNDAHREEHNHQTEKALQEATACLLVFEPPGLKDQTLKLLERVATVTHRVVFVLNKSDLLLDPEDLETTLAETRHVLQQEFPNIPPRLFAVSALWELKQEVANLDDLQWYGPPCHELPALRRYLLQYLSGDAEALGWPLASP